VPDQKGARTVATKRKPGAKRGGSRPAPIERHPRRFEIACIWAFLGFGVGPFDAARRALVVVKGGSISMADIEGVLRMSQVCVPLPESVDEPNAAERRLFAMAKRRRAELWLVQSSAFIQGLIIFVQTRNVTGACMCLDNLLLRGWRPVIAGLAERIETMLQSNVPPAGLAELGPEARQLVERVTGVKFSKRPHRKK
jgi:hypothetical protein